MSRAGGHVVDHKSSQRCSLYSAGSRQVLPQLHTEESGSLHRWYILAYDLEYITDS
jgi:hypothetical protein